MYICVCLTYYKYTTHRTNKGKWLTVVEFVSQFYSSNLWMALVFATSVLMLVSCCPWWTSPPGKVNAKILDIPVTRKCFAKLLSCFLHLSFWILYRKHVVKKSVAAESCHCLNNFWPCDGSIHSALASARKQLQNCSYKTGCWVSIISFSKLHVVAFWNELWFAGGAWQGD